MSIVQFIRLCRRNWVILVVSPVILFSLVFFLTQKQHKEYASNSTIYTGIATGSSIVSLEESRLDLYGSRAAFDNLINIVESQTTAEEVGLRLLALHLCIEKPVPEIISGEAYSKLSEMIPAEVKALVVNNNENQTYKNLQEFKNSSYDNFIYELIHLNNPYYSFDEILDKLKVSRIQTSDLIELRYICDDPGICQYTLRYFNEIFVRTYSELKVNQSDAVVRYFQNQLDTAKARLDYAENELLEFNKTNNIINYYEQTQHITSEKEQFNLTQFELRMKNAGAKSALSTLENKLSANEKRIVNSREINNLRQKLVATKQQIALKTYQEQLETASNDQLIKEISELRVKAYNLEEEMKNLVNQQYYLDNTIDGLPSTSILNEWLIKVIELESSNAELEIAGKQQNEYQKLFSQYAPLGANLKRLERKIDVAEREYLSILQSLGLAQLKQQNVEMNSNLKIISPPFFPVKPEPGKQRYLLLAALILGVLIPLSFILAFEFLNPHIRTLKRASELSGLNVISAIPDSGKIRKNSGLNSKTSRAFEITAQKLISAFINNTGKKPLTSIVFSNFDGEGKTFVISGVAEKLKEFGYKTLILSHNQAELNQNPLIKSYKMPANFPAVENLSQLTTGNTDIQDNYDFIFIEIPGVIHHPVPIQLIRNADQILMVTQANRHWEEADSLSLNNIIEFTGQDKTAMILNGVDKNEIGNILG